MYQLTANNIIIIATVLTSILAWQGNSKLMDKFLFWPALIRQNPKEAYRFISSGFIHADVMHLFFNLITLYFFGSLVEHLMGSIQYTLFYMLALIVSHVSTYIKNKNNWSYRSLGASGAVSAVLFVFIFFAPWEKIALFGILELPSVIFAALYLGISFYLSRKGEGSINHDAHIWGALFGWLYVILFIDPKHAMTFIDNLMNVRF